MAKLYQYALILEPTVDEAKVGGKASILVEPTTVLADSDQSATILAGRAIPEANIGDLGRITVVVRPF